MYIYSNCIGTFVFNQNFKIREKILFTGDESLKNSGLIRQGEVLDSEKTFLKKFKNIENLRETTDTTKLKKLGFSIKFSLEEGIRNYIENHLEK